MFTDITYFSQLLQIPNTNEQKAYLNNIIDTVEPIVLKKALGIQLYNDFLEGLQVGSDVRTNVTYSNIVGEEEITITDKAILYLHISEVSGSGTVSIYINDRLVANEIGSKRITTYPASSTIKIITTNNLTVDVVFEVWDYTIVSDTIEEKWEELRNGCDFIMNIDGVEVLKHWQGLVNIEKQSLLADFVYFEYCTQTASSLQAVGNSAPMAANGERITNMIKPSLAYNRGVENLGGLIETDKKGNLFNFIYARNEEHGDDYYPNWLFEVTECINKYNI